MRSTTPVPRRHQTCTGLLTRTPLRLALAFGGFSSFADDSLKEKLAQIHSASAKLKEVQAEQQAKLEQQRAEQAMLEKIQLEQKMKLLEQQVRRA